MGLDRRLRSVFCVAAAMACFVRLRAFDAGGFHASVRVRRASALRRNAGCRRSAAPQLLPLAFRSYAGQRQKQRSTDLITRCFSEPSDAAAAAASDEPAARVVRGNGRSNASVRNSDLVQQVGGGDFKLRLWIETVEDMEDLAALLACVSAPPDCVLLDGDLGAGKTTFSRGFITCKLGAGGASRPSPSVDSTPARVTSPTYLLSNTYVFDNGESVGGRDSAVSEIRHMDLYRLPGASPDEFAPLDLEHVFSNCISLIEWPERLLDLFQSADMTVSTSAGSCLPLPSHSHRLDVDIRIRPGTDERIMTLATASESTWRSRLDDLVEQGMMDDLIIDDNDDDDNDDGDDDNDNDNDQQ